MHKKGTILITGGTGFAGSHLVEALIQANYKDIHVTAYGSDAGYVANLLAPQKIHRLNLIHTQEVFNLIKKLQPKQIYHLAAMAAVGKSFDQEKKVLENNLNLQLNLLKAIQLHSPHSKLLVVGSALEYQAQDKALKETDQLGPNNPYAVSKVMQEMLAYSYYRNHQLKIVFARPFNHIGERQAPGFVVPDFAQQIVKIEQNKQKKIKVGNLEAIRDFSDVKDIVKAYILLMEQGKIGEIYNLGSGQGYSIKQLLDLMIKHAKTEITVEIDKDKFRPLDTKSVIADNSKISKLNWQATKNIEPVLERILNFYRHNQ